MAQRPAIKKRPMPYTRMSELSSARVGGKIIYSTDDWFASAPNLLRTQLPLFVPDKFTTQGKWMDGWESRRKRIAGHDWCLIKLGMPGFIRGIDVDTSFFTGNHSPRCSIQAAYLNEEQMKMAERLMAFRNDSCSGDGGDGYSDGMIGTACTPETQALAEQLGSGEWDELLAYTELEPGYEDCACQSFAISETDKTPAYNVVRLNMYPDGGIARLKIYGEVQSHHSPAGGPIDLLAAVNGGSAVSWSDAHFGQPSYLINPGRGINMGDGWETARKLTRPRVLEVAPDGLVVSPGSDWAVLRLCGTGKIAKIEVDTCHFKGNFPESCQVEVAWLEGDLRSANQRASQTDGSVEWKVLLPRTKLQADKQHYFELGQGLVDCGPATHVRLSMFPDGGVSQ